MTTKIFVLPIGILVLLFVSGCGPATGAVSGTVTYKGKPVCSGTVMLLADGGSPQYAELKDGGEFALSGVRVGKVRVTITSPDPARPLVVRGKTEVKVNGPADPRWFPLPEKYSDPENSGLQYDVSSRENIWAIKLQD